MINYLSLFSGIGGFEYGIKQSKNGDKFNCIGFSEVDNYAKSIYIRRFPTHKDLGDAREIDPKELQDFELLVGGFPCQAFSLSGKRQGFDDTRGTLFFEIARICEEKKPKYLLLENVKGLLSHDRGRTFKKILGVLSELGYDVQWQIYNSSHFGVPQNRERLYLKGYFRAKCGREILSQKGNRIKALDRLDSPKIRKVGNLSNTNHGGKNVYSKDGLSPTLCSESIPKNGVNIVENEVKLKPVKFNRQVRKRIHSTDYGELCEFLRKHKKAANATMVEISERLGVSKSEVDHWFRTDKYFAPPPPEVWDELKKMLDIKDDKYDAFITEFEYVDGVYEIDKRAYDETGLGSALTCNGESLVKVNKVGNINPSGHSQSGIVYGDDGLCGALCSTDHKNPPKVVNKDDVRIKVAGNVNPNGKDQSGIVYDTDGLCRTLTATDDKHPARIVVRGNLSNTNHRGEDVFDVNGLSRTLTETNYKHPLKIMEEDERKIVRVGSTNGHQSGDIYGVDGLCPTLCGFDKAKSITKIKEPSDNASTLKFKTNTNKGYDEVTTGDGVRLCHPSSTKARGRTQKGQTGALSTSSDWGTVDRDFRIRRLTPRECERLQAFPDDWTRYGKDGEEISDTQRYKCLGNAVTTTVISYIIDTMFGETNDCGT